MDTRCGAPALPANPGQEIREDQERRRALSAGQLPVTRHEVPNLWALNFLLEQSLGGGGTVSLRLDAQGKTLSHALLAMKVSVPKALVSAAERGDGAGVAAKGRRARG